MPQVQQRATEGYCSRPNHNHDRKGSADRAVVARSHSLHIYPESPQKPYTQTLILALGLILRLHHQRSDADVDI